MSRDLSHLTRHAYHGFLTEENIEAVAERFRRALGDRLFVTVQASPNRNDGIPKVSSGCHLTAPIEVRKFDDGSKALCFSVPDWSHMFVASARDQDHAYGMDVEDRTRIAFDGHTFTVSLRSVVGLDHYVFAPEGGDR
jgi:hypothetical protein